MYSTTSCGGMNISSGGEREREGSRERRERERERREEGVHLRDKEKVVSRSVT